MVDALWLLSARSVALEELVLAAERLHRSSTWFDCTSFKSPRHHTPVACEQVRKRAAGGIRKLHRAPLAAAGDEAVRARDG